MTHLVDLFRFFGGDVVEVAAVASHEDPEQARSAAVSLRFHSGQIGSLVYSSTAEEKQIGIQLITETTSRLLTGWDFRDEWTAEAEDPFLDETRCFLQAVAFDNSERVRSTMLDASKSQRVVEAVAKSIRRRATVTLD